MEKDVILLYTDGACVPNPGQMSIGGVLYFNGHTKEFAEKLDIGTNNKAELMAIKHGLSLIKNKGVPIVIISDSQYALNAISGKHKAKRNIGLINEIKAIIIEFKINFRWVRGHAGDKYNQRADRLANQFFINGYNL